MSKQNEAALAHVRAQIDAAGAVLLRTGETLGNEVVRAAQCTADALRDGKKLLLCGNGGSAADAQHIAAEFVGRFLKNRRALPAMALTTDSSNLTAIGNDYGFDQVFSRQVEALGVPGDVLIAISTSGRSPNIVAAVDRAREQQMHVIALTGQGASPIGERAEIVLAIPSDYTPHIQQGHITVLHVMCELVEQQLFGS